MGLTKNMCKTAKGVRVEQISFSMLEYANDEQEINLSVTNNSCFFNVCSEKFNVKKK